MTYKDGDRIIIKKLKYSKLSDYYKIGQKGTVSVISWGGMTCNENEIFVHFDNGRGYYVLKEDCRRLVKKPKFKVPDFSKRFGQAVKDCFGALDILLDKEEPKMQENKFDPGKPVQTRDGRKARIVCDDRKNIFPIVALIEDGNEECMCNYKPDGIYRYSSMVCSLSDPYLLDPRKDLINIPEPKPLDLHVGGVYKCKNGKIILIYNFDKEDIYCYQYYIFGMDGNGTCTINGREFDHSDSSNRWDLIEKIADIRDLHPEIKAYFDAKKV